MGVPKILLSENGRVKLAKATAVLFWICTVPAFICFIEGIYIQVTVEEKVHFIEDYNGLLLPVFMMVTGFLSFISCILSAKTCWSNSRLKKRTTWAKYLFAAAVATLVVFLLQFISGIMCFAHISDLDDSLHEGVSSTMRSYKNGLDEKRNLDVLQMEYECCGSRSYEDWFTVPWIHPDYLSPEKLKVMSNPGGMTEYINDDAPFSCCNPAVLRPCIHHHVFDNDEHYNYDYRQGVTLYTEGCTDVLMAFYEGKLLMPAGAMIFSLSFLQLLLAFLTRLLHTSIRTALLGDPMDRPTYGYIFPSKDDEGGSFHPLKIEEEEHVLKKVTSKNKTQVQDSEITEDTEETEETEETLDDTFDITFDSTFDTTMDSTLGTETTPLLQSDDMAADFMPEDSTLPFPPMPQEEELMAARGFGLPAGAEEPPYENVPRKPVYQNTMDTNETTEKHIYHDAEVEEYLAQRPSAVISGAPDMFDVPQDMLVDIEGAQPIYTRDDAINSTLIHETPGYRKTSSHYSRNGLFTANQSKSNYKKNGNTNIMGNISDNRNRSRESLVSGYYSYRLPNSSGSFAELETAPRSRQVLRAGRISKESLSTVKRQPSTAKYDGTGLKSNQDPTHTTYGKQIERKRTSSYGSMKNISHLKYIPSRKNLPQSSKINVTMSLSPQDTSYMPGQLSGSKPRQSGMSASYERNRYGDQSTPPPPPPLISNSEMRMSRPKNSSSTEQQRTQLELSHTPLPPTPPPPLLSTSAATNSNVNQSHVLYFKGSSGKPSSSSSSKESISNFVKLPCNATRTAISGLLKPRPFISSFLENKKPQPFKSTNSSEGKVVMPPPRRSSLMNSPLLDVPLPPSYSSAGGYK